MLKLLTTKDKENILKADIREKTHYIQRNKVKNFSRPFLKNHASQKIME